MKKIMKTNDPLAYLTALLCLFIASACGTLEEIDEDNDVIKTDDLQEKVIGGEIVTDAPDYVGVLLRSSFSENGTHQFANFCGLQARFQRYFNSVGRVKVVIVIVPVVDQAMQLFLGPFSQHWRRRELHHNLKVPQPSIEHHRHDD